MTIQKIHIDKEKIADFCRRHHIQKLSFFGSVLRDDFGPQSDVDVLVEFEPGHTPGLALIRIEDEMSELLGGRKVDLVLEEAIISRMRKYILEEAEVQYVQEG